MELRSNNPGVLIIAKQFLFRLGIKTLLSVIGIESDLKESDTPEEISKMLAVDEKTFLIIDEDLLGKPATRKLEAIKAEFPKSRLLVIGEKAIPGCPCSHFVLHSDSQMQMLEKFQSFFFEPEKEDNGSKGDNNILSSRETDILKQVARGNANKEIADNLHISINTVITHRKNITEKLGIKTIAGLTVYAIMNEIINPEEVTS